MEFRLSFTPKELLEKIKHTEKLMLIGSCFTENIGEKLMAHKFAVLQNPNGILFNPVSVAEAIDNYVGNKNISNRDLFELNEGFHSWQHHSRFSAPNPEDAVNAINLSTANAHKWLSEADWLIITLGSAWVYRLTDNALHGTVHSVAANNHKAPANWFNRELLSTEQLQSILHNMLEQLQQFNSRLKVIFTISPVRHLREGFVENNRSKSLLNLAVHEAIAAFENASYFPAYELVIDDLRDYRFFAEDMVHPNYAATNYVWEKFVEACIDKPSRELMAKINEINAAINHKPFNTQSQAHAKFKAANLEKISSLQKSFPYIDFKKELAFFS